MSFPADNIPDTHDNVPAGQGPDTQLPPQREAVDLPPPPDISPEDFNSEERLWEVDGDEDGGAVGQQGPPSSPQDERLQSLVNFLGVDPASADGSVSVTDSLRPVLDNIANAGQGDVNGFSLLTPPTYDAGVQDAQDPFQIPDWLQQQQEPPQQQQQQPELNQIELSDEDLADVPPSVAKTLKAMVAQQNLVAKQAVEQARKAEQQLRDQQNQQRQNYVKQQQQAFGQLQSRAHGYLDSLASGQYGVEGQRTFVQQVARTAVMKRAGELIRGMQAYGQGMPLIEDVMAAAVLSLDGTLPKQAAPQQPQQQKLPINAQQRSAFGTNRPSPTKVSNSSGAGGQLMQNAEYMEGARAILFR